MQCLTSQAPSLRTRYRCSRSYYFWDIPTPLCMLPYHFSVLKRLCSLFHFPFSISLWTWGDSAPLFTQSVHVLVGHCSIWRARVLSFVMTSAVMQGYLASNHAFFVFRSSTTRGTSPRDESRGRADIERRMESLAKALLSRCIAA